MKKKNNNISIYKYDDNLVNIFELEYCSELISYNKEYLIDFRKKSIEFRIKNKFVKRKQIWLINDRKDQAGDNGEYFFRYLKKIKPKEIIFYFVLDKNCPDFERLKNFENVIDFNSSQYLNKFLETDKIISSVSEPWVDNAFGIDGK